MTPPEAPEGPIDPATDAEISPATVVDLTTGSAHITPVLVDGEARYELDLPDQPLDEDDVATLAVALHAAQSGTAVLVDIEEYDEGGQAPEDTQDYQV